MVRSYDEAAIPAVYTMLEVEPYRGAAGFAQRLFRGLDLMVDVNEMGTAIKRTGHTMFIKETADFGSVLVTSEGEIFSAPLNVGVTVLIGTPMGDAIRAVENYEEGDVLIANDPASTGAMATHLPDLYLWRPVFSDGELLCFAWTFLHCSDIGGKVPGSISPTSSDLFQEGFVIPPTKVVKAGRLNEEFLSILHKNSRIPEQNWGDLKSLLAALSIGERRVHALVDRYSRDVPRNVVLHRQGMGRHRCATEEVLHRDDLHRRYCVH
jgi:N-methylhydantoinase B